jgi:hypothetical protein
MVLPQIVCDITTPEISIIAKNRGSIDSISNNDIGGII